MANYMELGNMDSYYEQAVKRRMSSTTVSGLILATFVIITVMVVSFYLSFTFISWFFPLALLMLGFGIYLIYYVLKNSRVEYEYTFVIGELRISRIKGRSKRRTITYFDVKAIDDFGKYIDPKTGKKAIDPSKYPNLLHAAVDDENPDTYYMIIHDKVRRKPAVLLLTPDNRTLEMIRPYLSVPLKKKYMELMKAEKNDKDSSGTAKADTAQEKADDIDEKNEKNESTDEREIKTDKRKTDTEGKSDSGKDNADGDSQDISTENEAKASSVDPDENKKPANQQNKPNGSKKPSNQQNRPNGNRKPSNQQNRPNGNRKPSNQQNRPNGNKKPSNQQNRPNGNRKPANQQNKPNGNRKPANQQNKPNGNKKPETRNDKSE